MNNKPLENIDIVKIQMVRDGTLEYGRKTIKGPQDLAELGLKFIKNADREVFLLVSLDTRNHINCIHVVSIGTVNTCLVAPREILKVAILSSASKIAFIHNHPSGDVDPSEDDIKITNRIAQCGDLFDIKLLDHVIICDEGRYESFLERGLIEKSDSFQPRVMDTQEKLEDEEEETNCEECGTTYIVRMLKEGEEYNDFGQRYSPFCGNMTLEW
jgi:DNA repair protein RadC